MISIMIMVFMLGLTLGVITGMFRMAWYYYKKIEILNCKIKELYELMQPRPLSEYNKKRIIASFHDEDY